MFKFFIVFYFVSIFNILHKCNCQMGPDPWDLQSSNTLTNKDDLPPDLRFTKKVLETKAESSQSMSDWFYKHLLTVILKRGQIRENEDGSIDVSLQMKYEQDEINILNGYMSSNDALSEKMYRRSISLIEKAIFKPTISDKVVMAWNEYIYIYFIEYKEFITWGSTFLACVTGLLWLCRHISYRHLVILSGALLYLYEAFISYKEAEKEEVDRFLSAVNACKWYFWTSECEVTPPDPLIMLKHMNPLKIGIRMFTTIVSEPMITMSATVNTLLHDITADIMYPFNRIFQGVLVFVFIVFLISMFATIILNYIFNVPFQISFFYNILNIALPKQYGTREPSVVQSHSTQGEPITSETLNKFLDVCSKALNTTQLNNNLNHMLSLTNTSHNSLKKSASAGRLSDLASNIPNKKINDKKLKKMIENKGEQQGRGAGDLSLPHTTNTFKL